MGLKANMELQIEVCYFSYTTLKAKFSVNMGVLYLSLIEVMYFWIFLEDYER